MRSGWIFVLAALLALSSVSNAFALGIAYEYMEGNFITVPQGNDRIFRLTLQNDQDKNVTVNVSVDSEIAMLRGESELELMPKTYNNAADILIKMPKDAPIGTNYTVRYLVTPVSDDSSGQVPFSVRYDRGFVVVVGPPAKQEPLLPEPTLERPAQTIPEKTASEEESSKPGIISGFGTTLLLVLCIAVVVVLVWKSSGKLSKAMQKKNPESQQSQQSSAQSSTQPAAQSVSQPIAQPIVQSNVVAHNNGDHAIGSVHAASQESSANDSLYRHHLVQNAPIAHTQNAQSTSTEHIEESATHVPIQHPKAELPAQLPEELFNDPNASVSSKAVVQQPAVQAPVAEQSSPIRRPSIISGLREEVEAAFKQQEVPQSIPQPVAVPIVAPSAIAPPVVAPVVAPQVTEPATLPTVAPVIQKPHKILPRAEGSERFFLAHGPALDSLEQLKDALKIMSDEQYSYHVNESRNDFASWTQGVFRLDDLASKMRYVNSKGQLLEVLENEL